MSKKLLLILLTGLFSLSTYAASSYDVTIVNHFNNTLNFHVGINPQVVPDLPVDFALGEKDTIKSKVLDIQKETYIGVRQDDKQAFFGIEILNEQVRFHGYIGKGIAYSWKDQTITFCTPQEYQKNHSC